MMIKLAIIGAVLLAGGILFSSELTDMLPQSVGAVSFEDEDFNGIKDSVAEIDSGISDANVRIGELVESSTSRVADTVREKLSQIEPLQILAGLLFSI